jgi:hypothetical protein
LLYGGATQLSNKIVEVHEIFTGIRSKRMNEYQRGSSAVQLGFQNC